MEIESTFEVDKRRLTHAWSCIIPAYFEYCLENSQTHGAGISIFRMTTMNQTRVEAEEVTNKESNCTFHYVQNESSFWETALKDAPNRDTLVAKYDPETTIMVCVHIPAIEGQDSTVGNIRLFKNVLVDGKPEEIEIV